MGDELHARSGCNFVLITDGQWIDQRNLVDYHQAFGIGEIADLVLSVNVGAYAIEMANPRHEHEWRVWEELPLPEDKVLIPGVIAHTTNVVEHPELIAERIVRLANVVGRERVLAGTDCGFAQGPYVRRVHPTIMWAKLRSLVEGAQLASTKLWP